MTNQNYNTAAVETQAYEATRRDAQAHLFEMECQASETNGTVWDNVAGIVIEIIIGAQLVYYRMIDTYSSEYDRFSTTNANEAAQQLASKFC